MINKDVPRIIPSSAHSISASAVSDNAINIIDQLKRAGYQAYLVGGCVRDLLLARIPKDFDLATDARPEEIKSMFRACRLIGRRFRLAHVRIGGEVIEIATFRAAPLPDDELDREQVHITDHGQVLRDNVYGTHQDDVLRRDFGINALYYDPQEQTVIDYVDGMSDLRDRMIRTIGDPLERFREDPVRMLRAVRFAAKLDFNIAPNAESAITEAASLLHHVPPARMLDEVTKLFHSGCALKTYKMLRSHSLFRYLFPFTEQCIDDMSPNLPAMALANTDARIQSGKPVIPAFLFACLLWDPVRADKDKLQDTGMDPRRAWSIATTDAIRDQAQHVAIPKRLAIVVKEIWALQSRLERRTPRSINMTLQHRRFRAAYDFLFLRTKANEIDPKIVDWWTRIQEADQREREAMIRALKSTRRGRGRKRKRRAA